MSVSPTSVPTSLNLGFLTVVQDAGGYVGGYLVTNSWGRPLEFRLTTAVQPTRVQQILYGGTLAEYVFADLIGKTLVEKTPTPPGLIVTDSLPALALRGRVGVPVVAVGPAAGDVVTIPSPRSPAVLLLRTADAADRAAVEALLGQIDAAVDLAEPFTRIREAVAEARKMGVTGRAA